MEDLTDILVNFYPRLEPGYTFERIAETVALLISEKSWKQCEFKEEDSVPYGLWYGHYFLAVHTTKMMRGLFTTMTDSLKDADKSYPIPLVTELGVFNELILGALRARILPEFIIPEFTNPLAKALRTEAMLCDIATTKWRLTLGEGESIYLQSIGKKDQPLFGDHPPRARAIPVRLKLQMPE